MESFIKTFIRASLLWFAAGTILGLAMAMHPLWTIYRPAHAHMNVVGFLTMLVFGVGYQLLPRLFGHPLHSTRLGVLHVYLANVGLALLVVGFFCMPHVPSIARWFMSIGGTLFAVGALCWVYNLWRTFDAADARRLHKPTERASLPTVDE